MMRHLEEFVTFNINLQHTNFKAFKLLLICAPYLYSIFLKNWKRKGSKMKHSEQPKFWNNKMMKVQNHGKNKRKLTFKNLCDSKE